MEIKRKKPPKSMTYITFSERETFLLAKKLAKGFSGSEVVFLIGELGSGKTVFAKGIAAGSGVRDVNRVCSPSFTLVNIYEGRYPVFHIDLYRLESEQEIRDLGWEEYIGQGLIIIEWAEKIKNYYDALRVIIKVESERRRKIEISPSTCEGTRKQIDRLRMK